MANTIDCVSALRDHSFSHRLFSRILHYALYVTLFYNFIIHSQANTGSVNH